MQDNNPSSKAALLWVLLAVGVLSYGLWHFIGTEKTGEYEQKLFDEKKEYPIIRLGYARGSFYAPDITIKPDVAFYYSNQKKLALNQVSLEGVWLVERDRIVSLGDASSLTVNIDSQELYATFSGISHLPVRYELNGKNAGSFQVVQEGEYLLSGASGVYFPKKITLFVPRGIAVYTLRPSY
ncbi:MAG: hypothetical protein KDK62_07110 [Chlamydiia bacterium]|nr:hypothetical protein [Chlamydiia bacterium]